MQRVHFFSLLIALSTLAVVDAEAVSKRDRGEVPEDRAVDDDSVPVDLGWGPRRGPPARKSVGPTTGIQTAEGFRELDAAALTPGPDAHIMGVFGPPFSMLLIPIHAALLPNGNIHYYGTDEAGNQGATLWHAVWEPELGPDGVFAAGTHTLLPNSTGTDIFCAGQALLPNSGKLMFTGGDAIVNGQRNWSNPDTNVYPPDGLALSQSMEINRWYPTLLALANGDMVVLGGRDAKSPPTYSPIPQVYTPGTGWKTLSTAKSDLAYGGTNTSWYYPRASQAPNGKVFVLAPDGGMFYLDPEGTGSIVPATSAKAPSSNGATLPSVNFAPGKILSLRKDKKVIIVNLNKSPPTFKATAPVSGVRYWSNAMVLASGEVMVSGGSGAKNVLTNVTYRAEIWDPITGKWTLGAAAQNPRLYHSIALLLPDASVLTAGGGAPGPVKNLNGEIFYPPYLWKADGSGLADRPSIESAPGTVVLGPNTKFNLTVRSGDSIGRVTLVRLGGVTHSFDASTRFMALNFTQAGTALTVTAPADPNVATPGYWMIFVIQNGVPSIAKILHLTT